MTTASRPGLARGTAKLDHVGFIVRDLDASADWYRRVLALTDVETAFTVDAYRMLFLERGGLGVQLIELDGAGDADALKSNDAGATHICVLTDDLDSEFKRLSAMGVHPTTPPATLVEGTPIRAMYCRDPNGLLVQMLQLPADWPHVFGTKVAGVHHVGLVVSDLERSIAWYESKLGLSIEALHDNSGPTVSDMFELPDTEERAALAPAGPCGLEIMTWTHPQGRPYTRARTDLGAMHLAFAVADPVEARTALVADDPTELRSYMHPSAPNRQGFNLEDPDGIPIEILEPAPNPR